MQVFWILTCVSLEEWFQSFRTIQRLYREDHTVHWLVHRYKVWISVYLLSPNYISRYMFVNVSCIHFYPNRSKNVDHKESTICIPQSKTWLLLYWFSWNLELFYGIAWRPALGFNQISHEIQGVAIKKPDSCSNPLLKKKSDNRNVIPFNVVPSPIPTPLPANFPLLEAVPQVILCYAVQELRRFCFHCIHGLEPGSFESRLDFREERKVARY